MKTTLLLLLACFPVLGAQADPSLEYAERAAKLEGKKDPKAWLKLVDFAEDQRLWDERDAALRKIVEADPHNAEAHARLGEARFGTSWLPADEAEAKEAEENRAKGLEFYGAAWVSPKEAGRLREADRKETGWDVQLRVETRHLQVYSARPLDFTRSLAGLLEYEVDAYQRYYGKVWKLEPKPKPFRVWVLPDHATYLKVLAANGVRGSGHIEKSAGMYSTGVQILFVSPIPDGDVPDQVRATAVHEMLHGLDDLLAHCMRSSPVWVREGRANYFAYGIEGRRITPGAIRIPLEGTKCNSLLLDRGRILSTPLSDMMSMDLAAFCDSRPEAHYALSLSWVFFLEYGDDGKHAAAFRTYLSGCPAGKASVADFEKTVGSLSELEPRFREFLDKELLPLASEYVTNTLLQANPEAAR